MKATWEPMVHGGEQQDHHAMMEADLRRRFWMWATGYNVVALPLAAGVLSGWGVVLQPEWGALIMGASTIIVAINAMLLRRLRLRPPAAVRQPCLHPPHQGINSLHTH